MSRFRGGPLEDGRDSQVHSLIVHMRGDGRSSIGAYVQVYDEDVPLGVFEWRPELDHDREIVEFVAWRPFGDAMPNGLTHSEVFEACARLGAPIERGRPIVVIVPKLQAWAREWLAQHPA